MPAYHAPERRLPGIDDLPTERSPSASGAAKLLTARSNAPDPEPLEWRPRPPLRSRIAHAVSTPAVAAGVLMVVAVLVAVVIVWLRPHAPGGGDTAASSSAANQVEPSASPGAEPRGGADAQGPAADAGTGMTPGSAFVHVVGEVAEPGVVELPAGARVRDALDAAGGPTKRAVLAGVNLARVVVDGEQITVPDTAEAEMSAAPGGGDTAESGGSGGSGANGASPGALVNLNTADAAALETLPRVGPALAQRIIDWRAANGAFTSVDQLLEVSGIGEKTLEGFRDQVTV